MTIGNNVQTIGNSTFSFCSGFTGSLTLGDNVQTIGDRAFSGCSGFTGSLTIGDNVQTIGESAFRNCSGFIGPLIIGNSVQTIGDEAFYSCSGFTGSLNIPDNVQSIGNSAFAGCKGFTGSLSIGDNVQTIGRYAFNSCSGFTGSLIIPDNVQTIEESTFSGCKGFTGSLIIGDDVLTIGPWAFSDCSGFTGSLTIGENVQTIREKAFYYCSGFTGSLIIPDNVQTIGTWAFIGCSGFTGSLTIGENVETIGDDAFWVCSGFTSLYLPSSSKSYGGPLFSSMPLKEITCLCETPPTIENITFNYDTRRSACLYVPSQSVEKYKTAAYWKDFSCINNIKVLPTSLTVKPTEKTLNIGESLDLEILILPAEAEDADLTFTTSNNNVASVDDDGRIIALTEGKTTITVETENGLKATCEVTVIPILANKVILSAEDLTLLVGQSGKLTATVEPANTTDQTVTWKSESESIATVGNDGTVTALATGVATITASCGEVSATCQVTVKGADDITVKPGEGTTPGNEDDTPGNNTEKGGSLVGNDLTLRVNQSAAIDLEIPEGLSVEPKFDWSLDNGGDIVNMTVADNTLSATFKGLKVGQTGYTVSIIGVNGNIEAVKGNITMIAETPMTSLRLEPASISLAQNALPVQLSTIVTPDNASMNEFSWESSVPTVATISQTGELKPVGQGKTVITCLALDGSGLSSTCEVTVTEPIDENFEFDFDESVMGGKEGISLYIGDTYKFIPKAKEGYVLPDVINWSTSDNTTVSVTDEGLVTALKLGKATITASANVNGKEVRATCEVTVIPILANKVVLSTENLILLVGQNDKLTAMVEPANTTNQSITWKSESESIATVGTDGTVTALAAGVANITATCGDATATCKVTVYGPDVVTMNPGDGTTPGDEDDTPGNTTENGGSLVGNDLTLRVKQTASIDLEIPEGLSVDPTFAWTLNNGGAEFVSMTIADNTLSATFKGLKVGQTGYTVSIVGVNSNIEAVKGKITVIAEVPMSSLELDPASITMAQNALPHTIKPVYTPENASMPEFNWASSVPTVATVDQNGKVTPVGQGQTLITATALDGSGLSAISTVTVTAPIDEDFGFDESVMGGVEGITIYIGDSYTLVPKAHDGYQLPENISWSSSDDKTVSVDQNGKVTGLALGSATISATATINGKEITATCTVTVIPIQPTSISITIHGETTLEINQTVQLTAEVLPENATDKTVVWTSSNEDVAKVTETGLVTALSAGESVITATNSAGQYDRVTITVISNEPDEPIIPEPAVEPADTPAQLLRKGDGTSHTFVAMMEKDDEVLEAENYRYVFGFNNPTEENTMIEDTPWRYTHTTEEIYWNAANDFWVFAYYVDDEGTLHASSRRHLDGTIDNDFNAADLIGSATRSGEHIVGIYTVDGQFVGKDIKKLGTGIYIIRTSSSSYKIIR